MDKDERIKAAMAAAEKAGGFNPHGIFDGKWGGWGAPRWFYGDAFGWMPRDVLERTRPTHNEAWPPRDGAWQWVKVWVDAEKSWRALTDQEIAALPDASDA